MNQLSEAEVKEVYIIIKKKEYIHQICLGDHINLDTLKIIEGEVEYGQTIPRYHVITARNMTIMKVNGKVHS